LQRAEGFPELLNRKLIKKFDNMENYLTVSELVKDIKGIVESQFGFVVIKGEVSNIKNSFSGHTYFSLKDGTAQIRCALFKYQKKNITHELVEDREYIVWGKVSLYEARCDLSIIVSLIVPFGEGRDALKLRMLKEKLSKEGLFKDEHKKLLPEFVEHIGVVTAEGGAAIHDIIRVGRNRFPGLRITLSPALVQGEGAEDTIVSAIEMLSREEGVDVIIVGRGGGSKEDLNAFNSEKVARAVVSSQKPVISAVGHEIDRTILDMVASFSVSTPSAAAELVTPEYKVMQDLISLSLGRMQQRIENILRENFIELDHIMHLFPHPENWLKEKGYRLNTLLMMAEKAVVGKYSKFKEHFSELNMRLETKSPLRPLENGYALVRQKGKIVKRAAGFKDGEELSIRFYDGEVYISAKDES
jgi:exodeoxyribonuclease VII large subunit